MNFRARSFILALVVLVELAACLPMVAQESSAVLNGRISDPNGMAVAGAKVHAVNINTNILYQSETNQDGLYNIHSLPAGTYRVTVDKEGFKLVVNPGVQLHVADNVAIDFRLELGSVSQTVTVEGGAPILDTTSASLGSLVDDHTIRALPLNGRSYDQLAALQPGVIVTSPGGSLGGSPFTFGTGKRFSVGGQRDIANSFLLDGTDINDQGNGTPGGAAGNNLGVDTILEFKIFTNSFKAEYGHSDGSVVTSITRSGTNVFHGTAFEYIRNSVLDERNYFDTTSSAPPFKRNQFGGVLGGPIRKDKTFFFLGYEGLRQGQETTQIATVPTALARQGMLPSGTVPVNPAVVPYLNLYPLPNGRDFGDGTAQFLSAPNVITNEDYFMARVDHQLTAKTAIFARYSFDQDSLNAPGSIPTFFQTEASRRQYTTLQANTALGPQALNNFRFAYNRTYSTGNQLFIPDPGPTLDLIPGQPMGAIVIGGTVAGGSRALTALGPSTGNGANLFAYNVYEWSDDFSYIVGRHSLKAGVDIQMLRDNTTNPSSLRGQYTFTSLNNLLAGVPSNLQAGSPLGVVPYFGLRQGLYAIYGQDDYTVNSRLTLNLGLRWETATDPSDVNGNTAILPSPAATATVLSDRYFSIGKKNFEPRVGLAWRLNASGKTVLRAGAGIYHNQLLPWSYFFQTAVPPFFGKFSASNPPFPDGYQILKPGGPLALNVMAPFLKTPVDDQYNVSIQQQLFKNTAVQIAYAGNHGNHLLTQWEADTATPVFCSTSLNNCPPGLANGQIYYPAGSPRLNTAWAGIRENATIGNSEYNSLTVTLMQRSSHGLQGQIFYTFSKSMDESSSTQNADSVRSPGALLDPFDPRRDWALSDFNAKNIVVGNFSYALPVRVGERALGAVVNNWTLDGIGTFTSGMPFTARLAAAVSRDLSTSLSERPNLVPGHSSNPTSGVSAGCPGFAAGTPVGNANNWYDPCSFSLPVAGTYGDLGRNTIIGPGVADMDLALEKAFRLGEKANLTFRAEVFNVMNHANFGLPNTSPLAASGTANPSAGVITYTTTSSRQIQFALRLAF